MSDATDLDPIDRDALERAMQVARRDPGRGEQPDSKLKDEPWDEVAVFASYVCQTAALALKPWEQPPGVANEDEPNVRDKDAQQLLRRMLAAGLSRYEPDPLAALRRRSRG